MNITLYRYDAFTDEPGKGNPAGVVLETEGLTAGQMQAIAKRADYSETAFVLPSDKADLRLRYFTPGQEVPLCGHATVGSMYALREKGIIGDGTVLVETGAGILPISVGEKDGRIRIGMTQAAYEETAFGGSRADLAAAMGLTEKDLDERYPVVYGCTGLWTIAVPLRGLECFSRIRADNAKFPAILTERPGASVHPFCLETVMEGVDIHARHFSSPLNGFKEDPVTGTASGVMGHYYKKYIAPPVEGDLRVVMEQGLEIGKAGIVEVIVPADGPVRIYGTAVAVETYPVDPAAL